MVGQMLRSGWGQRDILDLSLFFSELNASNSKMLGHSLTGRSKHGTELFHSTGMDGESLKWFLLQPLELMNTSAMGGNKES